MMVHMSIHSQNFSKDVPDYNWLAQGPALSRWENPVENYVFEFLEEGRIALVSLHSRNEEVKKRMNWILQGDDEVWLYFEDENDPYFIFRKEEFEWSISSPPLHVEKFENVVRIHKN